MIILCAIVIIVYVIPQLENASPPPDPKTPPTSNRTVYALFSPRGGCQNEIIRWIESANDSIHIMIYSFTSNEICDALIAAHNNNNITIRIIMEPTQISEHSQYHNLTAAGIEVLNRTSSGIMHNKVMTVDTTVVITGSYDWNISSETSSDDNIIVILNDTYILTQYNYKFITIWNEEQQKIIDKTPTATQAELVK